MAPDGVAIMVGVLYSVIREYIGESNTIHVGLRGKGL